MAVAYGESALDAAAVVECGGGEGSAVAGGSSFGLKNRATFKIKIKASTSKQGRLRRAVDNLINAL